MWNTLQVRLVTVQAGRAMLIKVASESARGGGRGITKAHALKRFAEPAGAIRWLFESWLGGDESDGEGEDDSLDRFHG